MLGRERERAALDELLVALRAGVSRICVIRGEAGIGKSMLLEHVAAGVTDVTVSRAQGIEADMELAYASLHQLCVPFLGAVDALPDPQRDALRVAFGMAAGDPPDRFLVGLAVLTLITRASEARPVLLLVDDAQWLDQVSLQTLEFVARRLLAEAVSMVLTVRDPEGAAVLEGLPALALAGLDGRSAGALLDSVVGGILEPRVRERLVAETHGNPLALLELARGRSATELGFGLDASDGRAVPSRVEDDYARRVRLLPEPTRTLLLVAAADPVGDARLLVRACEILGVVPDPKPAAEAGLIALAEPLRFRHPLVRSAVMREADAQQLRAVHRALAEATDAVTDPDRRAWHAARAATAPDEEVAGALVAAAHRARQRGGVAAEAALLERAVDLTPDAGARGRRALAAAEAHLAAGAADDAAGLATTAALCPLSALDQARLTRLRAQVLFALRRSEEAVPLLLDSAAQLASVRSPLARETYLEAIGTIVFSGRRQGAYGARAAAVAARSSGAPPSSSAAADQLLDGLAAILADGRARGIPMLRRALPGLLTEELPDRDATMRWLRIAQVAQEVYAHELWDFDAWDRLAERMVRLSREMGALSTLPLALMFAGGADFHRGDTARALSRIEEGLSISRSTGNAPFTYASLVVTAWRGDEAATSAALAAAHRSATEEGEVSLIGVSGHARAVLYNGLGRHELALAGAREGIEHDGFNFTGWTLAEHVEAAVRCGRRDDAIDSLDRLTERAAAAGSDWALGILARCRAMLDDDAADALFEEALTRLARAGIVIQVARTHLLYGEWLTSVGRRAGATDRLRQALEMLDACQIRAFAERARAGLTATGERAAPRRTNAAGTELTPQEAQIAALAAAGRTNPEIGAELFLSPHTVEWHLRKVYAKLGVRSRRQLPEALAPGRP